ncbi:hypothetical protein MPLSOD_280056 [Mesorhizobium sp. SOD10]|nr:hypothetical protein MPLSOD_280056 [Mesorhizobium sp. SOD10]
MFHRVDMTGVEGMISISKEREAKLRATLAETCVPLSFWPRACRRTCKPLCCETRLIRRGCSCSP